MWLVQFGVMGSNGFHGKDLDRQKVERTSRKVWQNILLCIISSLSSDSFKKCTEAQTGNRICFPGNFEQFSVRGCSSIT